MTCTRPPVLRSVSSLSRRATLRPGLRPPQIPGLRHGHLVRAAEEALLAPHAPGEIRSALSDLIPVPMLVWESKIVTDKDGGLRRKCDNFRIYYLKIQVYYL